MTLTHIRRQAKSGGLHVLVNAVTTVVVVLPALAALYSAADAVGMPLPRLVFERALADAERRAHRNIWAVGDAVVQRIERELHTAEAAIDGYRLRGETPPDYLLYQRTIIQLQLDELRRAVEDSRRVDERVRR